MNTPQETCLNLSSIYRSKQHYKVGVDVNGTVTLHTVGRSLIHVPSNMSKQILQS